MRKQHHAPERQKQQRQDGCSLEGMYLSLVSRIYGPILALEGVQACDRVPFP